MVWTITHEGGVFVARCDGETVVHTNGKQLGKQLWCRNDTVEVRYQYNLKLDEP